MKKILTLILFLCSTLFAVAERVNSKPFVVPELTSWQGGEGNFLPSGRVVVKSKQLRAVAEKFAADYRTLFGRSLVLTSGQP